MKVIVFGSNGLVGSSVIRNLRQDGTISELYESSRNDTDLFSLSETSKLINSFKPDIVINAAARVGGILANNSYRSDFILENLKININVLESIIKFPEIKVVNLGSSCIYPLGATNPISENSLMSGKLEPTNSPYAMAKLTAIELGDALHQQYGHQVLNIMPTNLYGPNDNFSELDSHVIPGLISRLHIAKLNNEDVFKVWGTGKPLREFLYVDDLADAISFFIKNSIFNGLYNVGSGNEISILDLVNKIKNIVQYQGEVEFDNTKPDGNPRKLLDSSKVNKLGWEAKTPLDVGLENTYKWFVDNQTNKN